MEVLIQPLRKVIEVSPGANLLDALRAAQVPVSYSCMAGRCGTCRCKVLSGEVLDAGRDRQNPLDAADAYVLACQTFLTEPCTIEIPEPDEIVVHPACVVKSTVQSVESIAHDIKRLILKPARAFDYSPGQYAELRFTSQLSRPYAMAGLGGPSTLEFHVRVVPGGRASGHVANDLKPGDTVRVSGLAVDAIERDIDSLAGWQAYLYGSPPMVEATAVLARRKGIEAVRIHAEAFYTQPS
jgi:ferredoxin-NAD(P)+ reductase (naphthalene dioxygenase ferredoxin-specific)